MTSPRARSRSPRLQAHEVRMSRLDWINTHGTSRNHFWGESYSDAQGRVLIHSNLKGFLIFPYLFGVCVCQELWMDIDTW